MSEPNEYDKLLQACQDLRIAAGIQERRMIRMEKIQMALLKAAGAFLRSLEEQEHDGAGGNGQGA